jgi:alkylation response protein AidB-like acyl-CoA dehydrogenase
VWTSGAQHSDYGILLTRTNPDRPKHQGITYFLFPMRQPGVEVRPLREMTGHAMFNEVFLDGARVHDGLRLGDVGAGWAVANTTLGFERAAIGEAGGGFGRATPGSVAGDLDRPCREFLNAARPHFSQGHISPGTVKRLLTVAGERGRLGDPIIRQAVADLHTRVQLLAWNAQRAKDAAGGRTGVEGPLAKIAMTDALRRARELGCRILGADAQLSASDVATERWFQLLLLYSPAPSIYGGTNEIQRNIIGERGLGLPREPGPSRDTPFNDLTPNGREAGYG